MSESGCICIDEVMLDSFTALYTQYSICQWLSPTCFPSGRNASANANAGARDAIALLPLV
ncbi:hypothetical protein [Allocoleopsis sp.]|uniref:hypothetical protein n=1 Tax=Allocoleopsis sp. TaxID=3088169 RepID=UPI002FD4950E